MNRATVRPVRARHQRGATLVEILVSVLILSFGLLAIGNMMAYAVQLPKLAGNRAVASTLAIDLVERIRANAGAFAADLYVANSFTASREALAVDTTQQCAYPNCTPGALATQDLHDIARDARMQLPFGGIVVQKNASDDEGRIFVLWKEAASAGALGKAGELYAGDICPPLSSTLAASAPRCVMVKFKP